MVIIDAQVHIWGANTPERPWPPGAEAYVHRPQPLGKDELLREMDAAGVNRAVLVPPSWEGDRNDLALAAAQQHPDRFAVMGRLALERPESRAQLATWKAQPGMLGVRLTFHRPPHSDWLSDGTADWFWPAAERAGLPVMVFAPGQVSKIGDIAARHPGLRLIIDHLALRSDLKDHALAAAIEPVLALARFPNVAVKASALPCYVTEPYPFPTLHPLIRRVVEAFGPQRVFWGTDLSRLPCPYRQAVTLFTEELDFLSDDDKAWIMGRGLAAWLDWPLTP
ncbi:MAG: metal-dependent hydrolase [Candidatus Tectimicrobiota bacterium]|nr:MAG: metal-dependent hydrolase [Candidatus Tectomicrobia bacterium]